MKHNPDELLIWRDEHGTHVNVDRLLVYIFACVVLVGFAIKFIRWAATS